MQNLTQAKYHFQVKTSPSTPAYSVSSSPILYSYFFPTFALHIFHIHSTTSFSPFSVISTTLISLQIDKLIHLSAIMPHTAAPIIMPKNVSAPTKDSSTLSTFHTKYLVHTQISSCNACTQKHCQYKMIWLCLIN